jgi:sulfur carrier protein
MKVYVNDEKATVEQGQTLAQLLKGYDLNSQEGIAVAVNDEVIPQPQWADYQLKAQDNILLITATQGG